MFNLDAIRDALRPGIERWVRATPEERTRMAEEEQALRSQQATAEIARYNAMSSTERAEYDAMTRGMMPRAY